MKHLTQSQIALHAGGDLPLFESLLARLHLRRCPRCRQQLAAFAALRQETAEAALELPPGVDWQSLEMEMRANIRLGLTAGAIVDQAFSPEPDPEPEELETTAPEPEPAHIPVRRLNWSLSSPWLPGAAVLGSLTVVVVLVWLLSYPPVSHAPGRYAQAPGSTVMTAENAGLELRHGGGALTLLPPAAEHASLSVDLGAGARAEYVDVETGQMTIHQVFYGDDE